MTGLGLRAGAGDIPMAEANRFFDVEPATRLEGDNFGAALAVAGDVLVIAAPWADIDSRQNSGVVYVKVQ